MIDQEEMKAIVKRGIEQGLDIVANTPLGTRVRYAEGAIEVLTTMSELVIQFVASTYLFTCRIPLWVNGCYDLTDNGVGLSNFNNERFLRMDSWVLATMVGSEAYQQAIAYQNVKASVEKEPSNISFSLTVQHTKNRFTRIEGEEVWDYIEMPTDTTMKFVDPKNNEPLQAARLEISFEGEELSIEDLVTEFRRQYVEKQ